MRIASLSQAALLLLPLFLLAFAAGALRVAAARSANPRRRRLCQALWVVLLLVGAPLWLFLATALGIA